MQHTYPTLPAFRITILVLLLLAMQRLDAQSFQVPISGHLYGQGIVACSGGSGHLSYAATGTAIYARPGNANDYYAKVWTAPGNLHIASFSNVWQGGSGHRAILLSDQNSNSYIVYTQINTSAADSTISGPVLLPPAITGHYTRVVAGAAIYVYSILSGGPPGNLTVSRDNGQTWQVDTPGISYDAVYDIAVDTALNAYITGPGGIYRQLPAGGAWTLQNADSHNSSVIFIDPADRMLISSYGIYTYISVNGGITFSPDSIGISGQVQCLTSDVYGDLYAVAGGSIYLNTGGTGPWTDINAAFSTATGGYGEVSCMSGDSVLTIGTSNYGMFTSSDQGTTCAATNNGILAEDIYSIVTQPDGRQVCTSDLGMFYKDPADSIWHQSSLVTPFFPGTQLFNDSAGDIFVAVTPTFGTPYPLGLSTDDGVSFAVDSDGFSSIGATGFYMDETGAKHFYAYYAGGAYPLALWSSPFGSSVWSPDTAGLPLFTTGGTGAMGMCSDRQGFLYISMNLAWGDVFYRRPVRGTQWVIDSAGTGAMPQVSVMAASASAGIYAANVTKILHRGATAWQELPSDGLGDSTASGTGIKALSVDAGGTIFAAYSNYTDPDSNAVYYSSDNGQSWHFAGLMGMATDDLVSIDSTTYALTYGNWGYVSGPGISDGILTPVAVSDGGLRAFPNPSACGIWNIETTDAWTGSQLELTDMSGRVVYRSAINEENTQISTQGLMPGVYILHVYRANADCDLKLVK